MSAKPAAPRLGRLQFALVGASVFAAVLPHLWRLPPVYSALVSAVFVARMLQRLRGGARIPAWLKLPLVLIFPLFVILHYGNIFGREPGSALACAMLVLKLLETESRRDARAAVCFASFVLMSALLFNSSLTLALLLFAALAVFLATLRELEPRPLRTARPWRRALLQDLRSGAAALLAAVPLALCVFAFFPRLGSPLWGRPNDVSARTGLGDNMAPGTIQELLLDDSPAFRVTFDGIPPPRALMYWRGPVLWHFNGRAWMRPDYLVGTRAPTEVQPIGAQFGYEVILEPTDRHWLLGLDVPTQIPDGAVRGSDMTLVSRAPVDHLLRYHSASAPRYKLEASLDGERRRLAMQLPPGFDPLAVEVAQRWRRELHTDDAIIAAALALFRRDFTYTLTPPELGRDSVDEFLFSTQQGFCEHFSSAFTFLMRAAGIPARVVTGYQGGYYNEVGNYYVVRQSDAHAWSEVWLEGRGWVRVDPTAAVSPQRVQLGAHAAAAASAAWYQAEWLLALRNQFDLVNRVWNDAIVQFNVARQQSLLAPFGIDKAEYSELMSVLIGLSSLLLGALAWWTLRTPPTHADPLDAAYERLCRKVARAGAPRRANEGPLAFGQRIAATGLRATREPLELCAEYATLRYACALAPAAAVRAFASHVTALRVHPPAMRTR